MPQIAVNDPFLVVTSLPDVCNTPLPPAIVPVPYPTIAKLISKASQSTTVKILGKAIWLKGEGEPLSELVIGNEAGIEGGVASGVNGLTGGQVKAVTSSKTTKVEKKHILRLGDLCEMNASEAAPNTTAVITGVQPGAPVSNTE